jgi:hypothetical protein
VSAPKVQTPNGPKVSPARTIVSLVLLLVVGVVCVVELRAGLGQMWTTNAMKANTKDGEFDGMALGDAKKLISMAPAESVTQEDSQSVTYKYEWKSLLRPLMGETNPVVFLIASKREPSMALAYHTDPTEDPAPVAVPLEPMSTEGAIIAPPNMGGGEGGPGMGAGMGGGMGSGMGGGGGRRGKRPAAEGDDAPAEGQPAEGTPTGDPPVGEDAAPTSDAPAAEAPAAEAATETLAPDTDAPAGVAPAAEAPKSDAPAAEPTAETPPAETPAPNN